MRLLLVALLLTTSICQAANLNFSSPGSYKYGTLADTQTANGVSTNTISCNGATVLVITYTISGTVTGVSTEFSINGASGTFFPITDSSQTVSSAFVISIPVGVYRTSVAGCSSCSVTTAFACGWVR